MTRRAGLWFLAALLALPGVALGSPLSPADALKALAAHGMAPGYVSGRALDSSQTALLAARAIARVEAGGATPSDIANAQRLLDAMPDQLDALGVRASDVRAEIGHLQARAHSVAELPAAQSVTFGSVAQDFGVRLQFSPQAGPLAAQIRGISFTEPHPHAFLPRAESIARAQALARRDPLHDGYVHFGSARFGSQSHSPITLALFGMVQPSVALQAPVTIANSPFTTVLGTPGTPSPLVTPDSDAGENALAGISFRARAVVPPMPGATLAIAPAFTRLPPVVAFRTLPVHLNSQSLLAAPAFSTALNAPSAFVSPSPGEVAAPAPSGFGSSFYNALVPNSSGLELRLSAPLRIGAVNFRGTFNAAHLQEDAPNAYGTMPSQPATTDRLGAGTTFDVRAFGRSVSLDLGTAYERLTRDDRSALSYTQYTPPATGNPVATSYVAPDLGAPGYVNPNYLNVTRRSLNASAAVPLTHALSLNLQYNAQFYSGSYSTLQQNIDERKDSYLGNLTYQIPRSSSAIVFSAKQYRYRDAFVPAYNVTQNRADLNFTVKF